MSAGWVRVLRGMIDRGTCTVDLIDAAETNRHVITADEAVELRDYWHEKNPEVPAETEAEAPSDASG